VSLNFVDQNISGLKFRDRFIVIHQGFSMFSRSTTCLRDFHLTTISSATAQTPRTANSSSRTSSSTHSRSFFSVSLAEKHSIRHWRIKQWTGMHMTELGPSTRTSSAAIFSNTSKFIIQTTLFPSWPPFRICLASSSMFFAFVWIIFFQSCTAIVIVEIITNCSNSMVCDFISIC